MVELALYATTAHLISGLLPDPTERFVRLSASLRTFGEHTPLLPAGLKLEHPGSILHIPPVVQTQRVTRMAGEHIFRVLGQ